MPVSCFLRRLLTHASSRVRPAALFLAMAGLAATGQLALATPAHAGPAPLEKVTPYAGWQTQLGKNLSPIGEKYSTPAVGDVLGGGGTEVVAGFPDGTVRVFGADGRQLLTFNTGAGAVQASPVLVDVNHDGILDVVAANLAGDVVAFDGRGRTLFHQRVMGGVFGTPAVADLQGNGRLDVVATSWDQHVYAWHLDDASALPGWPVAVGDTIWSSPSIAHLDGDPLPEVVFGFDCDGAPGQRCAPNWGGYVGVLRHDGSWRPGFPVFVAHQVVWSTPAVADLEGTGHLDIVVGTGNMTTSMCCGKPMRGTQVFAFRADGSNVPGWPAYIGANATSSPAIGDLEGNGTWTWPSPLRTGGSMYSAAMVNRSGPRASPMTSPVLADSTYTPRPRSQMSSATAIKSSSSVVSNGSTSSMATAPASPQGKAPPTPIRSLPPPQWPRSAAEPGSWRRPPPKLAAP